MACDQETGILMGRGIAASQALTHSIDAARHATWHIEQSIGALPEQTGIPAHVRADVEKLRDLVRRLDAAVAGTSELRKAA